MIAQFHIPRRLIGCTRCRWAPAFASGFCAACDTLRTRAGVPAVDDNYAPRRAAA